jgi:hypothetical protein
MAAKKEVPKVEPVKKTPAYITVYNAGVKPIPLDVSKRIYLQPTRGKKIEGERALELLKKFKDLKEVNL